MISYQVDDVVKMFEDLDKLEANGWIPPRQESENADPKVTKKPTKPKLAKTKKNPGAPSKSRLALRQMMAAGRKQMEEETKQGATALLAPRTPTSVLRPANRAVEKVFDGGFFAVRSPRRGSDGNK